MSYSAYIPSLDVSSESPIDQAIKAELYGLSPAEISHRNQQTLKSYRTVITADGTDQPAN